MKLLALFLAHPLADLSHLWLFSTTCKLVVQAFEPCLLRYLCSVQFFFFVLHFLFFIVFLFFSFFLKKTTKKQASLPYSVLEKRLKSYINPYQIANNVNS